MRHTTVLLAVLATAYAPNPWGQEPPVGQIPSISTVLEIQQLVIDYMAPLTPAQIRDFAGGTLRLMFHDAAEWEGQLDQGGSDGCLDLTIPSNNGLARMVEEIDHNICDQYCTQTLCRVSRADCWWWVGEVVVEQTGGPRAEPETFLWGRRTTNTCPTPTDLLPGAEIGWSDFHRIMVAQLGLDVVDAVALIGAHTVGRMRCPHSGFHGSWDSTPHVFDNEYFQRIAAKDQMDQYEIDAPSGSSGVIHFWTGSPPCVGQAPTRSPDSCGVRGQCTCNSAGPIFPETGAQSSSLVLLNADLAFAAATDTPCTTTNGAGLAPPTDTAHVEAASWAAQFATNRDLFFEKFHDAYRKSANIGHNPMQLRRAAPLPVHYVAALDGQGRRGDLPAISYSTNAQGATIATDTSALHDGFIPCYLTASCTRFTCDMFPVSFYYDTGVPMQIHKIQIATDRGDNRPHWMVQESDDNITWGHEVHQVGDSLTDNSTCGNGVTTFAHRPCRFEGSNAETAFLSSRFTQMNYPSTKRYFKLTLLSVGICLGRAPVEELFQGINSQWDAIEFLGRVTGASFPASAPAPAQLIGGESLAARNAAFFSMPPSDADVARSPEQCDNRGECGRCLMLLSAAECPAYFSSYFGCSGGGSCPAYVECTHTMEGQLCQPPNGNGQCGIGGGTTSRTLASGAIVGPNCGGMYIFRNAQVFASPPDPPSPPAPPPPSIFITSPTYCATTADSQNYQFRGHTDRTDGGALIRGGITSIDYNNMMNDWRAEGSHLTSVSVTQCQARCTAQYPCVGFNYRAGNSASTGECNLYLRMDAPMLDLYTPWTSSSFATPSSEWLSYFNSRHEAPPCMQTSYPTPQMLWCRGSFQDASGSTPGPRVNADGGCGGFHHAYMARGVRHTSCSRRHCAEECENDPACVGFDITGDYGQCWTRSGVRTTEPNGPGGTMVNMRAVERGMVSQGDCTWVGPFPPSPPSPPRPPPSPPAPPGAPPPPAPPPVQFTYYTQRLSFTDAEAFCIQNGGHLASLHSVAAVNMVNALRGGQDSWIGLVRSSTSVPWTWSDGSTFGVDPLSPRGVTTLWNTQFGVQGNDNVCARWGWGASGTWDDVSCGEAKPFTCQAGVFAAVSPSPPSPPPTPSPPPSPMPMPSPSPPPSPLPHSPYAPPGSPSPPPAASPPPPPSPLPPASPPPPPSPPPYTPPTPVSGELNAGGVAYCHVAGEYYENGRTSFGGDVIQGTLDACASACSHILACIGFDTSVTLGGTGTCWLKSRISIAPADIRTTSGSRTTYFSSRLESSQRRCRFDGESANPPPPPSAPPIPRLPYCHVAGEYYENGRTSFGNDVISGGTLATCEARCDSIQACIGFDTSVTPGNTGTCWLKSFICTDPSCIRHTTGSRTTYFNSRAVNPRCTPGGGTGTGVLSPSSPPPSPSASPPPRRQLCQRWCRNRFAHNCANYPQHCGGCNRCQRTEASQATANLMVSQKNEMGQSAGVLLPSN